VDFGLIHTAVWWERGDPDGYGDFDWEDPVEVDCRWVQSNDLFTDSLGEEKRCTARVYLDRDVTVGDFLKLGDLDDITSASGYPPNKDGAYQVQRFDKIPDLAGGEILRRAWL